LLPFLVIPQERAIASECRDLLSMRLWLASARITVGPDTRGPAGRSCGMTMKGAAPAEDKCAVVHSRALTTLAHLDTRPERRPYSLR
jgi:hypothetical protein